jgi:hypothetical protein
MDFFLSQGCGVRERKRLTFQDGLIPIQLRRISNTLEVDGLTDDEEFSELLDDLFALVGALAVLGEVGGDGLGSLD